MRAIKRFTAATLVIFQLSACVKDKKVEPVVEPEGRTPAKVAFDFTATVNNKPLVASSAWYSNAVGDSFTITKFNYYISNIKFIRDDGFAYSEPESYHINKHTDGACTFELSDLPEGNYNSVEFLIGVDSVRNHSGAQTGALDVAQGMYWDWNTGYVFFKLEGSYKNSETPVPADYAIHVATTANLQKCKFNLVTGLVATKGKTSKLHYNVSVDEIFSSPADIDMDTFHAVTGGKMANIISANYKDMFTVKQVEN